MIVRPVQQARNPKFNHRSGRSHPPNHRETPCSAPYSQWPGTGELTTPTRFRLLSFARKIGSGALHLNVEASYA